MPLTPHHVAVLRIVDPSGDEHVVLADQPALHIGSSRAATSLTLTGHGIAANHCTLRWHDTHWILHDRGAPSGTYVNNRRCMEPTGLCPGDRISIAHHLIHFNLLPSLELPHVLERLRDAPTSWLPVRLQPPPPPPPPAKPRRAPRRAAALALLCAALGLAASASNARITDLSPKTSPPETARAASTPRAPPDLSPGPAETIPARAASTPRAPPDLSPGPAGPSPPGVTEYVTEPPTFELPPDAVSLGQPTDGALVNALRLPPSPDYTVRCPGHAHGTTATIGELMHALATLRNRGYTGEIVVGDLSREDGGQYGPHKSHQSGRDVDLWLPILGGRYDRGCPRCGTDLCRPEPEAVDWRATWRLIESLAERGHVQDIFLDWSLHPHLQQAALELGVPAAEIHQQIQHPIHGRPTLVKHSDGHVHHLHVRFREPSASG